MPDPLYTTASCRPAYQLRWSLALFVKQPLPPSDEWIDLLTAEAERDGVRVLDSCVQNRNPFFTLSSRPEVSAPQIVKSIKGRLQNAIQHQVPKAFRRNFHLTSLGAANRKSTEAYVAQQLGHHHMADERVDRMLADFQLQFPDVDLSQPQYSSHGMYLYNLHVVLVHQERWNDICRTRLQTTTDMVVRSARVKGHRLSRVALLADHIHLTVGVPFDATPEGVALSYMNNIAFAHGMTHLFAPSYYVGTFGEYDMNAVRRS
ncbi:MAG: hypothetical protein JSS49_25100 [Planctomycetes bacterium]|nr:hypothetical protein [Planctomycetota bacterium]